MSRTLHDQGGFSLLEVVVAFAIAAIALSILSQIFGQGSRNLALSRDYTDALVLADSLLAEYGNIKKPESRSYSDTGERFHWNVAIEPYEAPEAEIDESSKADAAAVGLSLMHINVAVEWNRYGKSRSISTNSLRVVADQNDAARQ